MTTTPPDRAAARRTAAPKRHGSAELDSHIVDNAVYEGGKRVASPDSLQVTFETLAARPKAMAWIGLYRPSEDQLDALATKFGLHHLSIEDAVHAHQRPKVERYGDTLFMVLRAAGYVDEDERVEFGELHVFAGENFLITVRHAETPDLADVRQRMEDAPDALRLGTEAVLYAILDAVVDGYKPVVKGLANDIDEIETQVFDGDPSVSRRIYELTREVIEFERTVSPLVGIIQSLSEGIFDGHVEPELTSYLRDVLDHVVVAKEQIEEFRVLLRDILAVNATLVGERQNEEAARLSQTNLRQAEETRRISGWAAILFAPSLIGSIYGMNFDHMPELQWEFGYPAALLAMVASSVVLYIVFKRRGWL